MKQFCIFALCLTMTLSSCSSTEPEPKDLGEFDQTTKSTEYLREGKELFDRIYSKQERKAEDFDEVIKLWLEGLRYQPKNTLIRKEVVVLLFSMAKAYVDRRQIQLGMAEEAKKQNKKGKEQELLIQAEDSEKKAQDCYQRVLTHLSVLLTHRSPQDPEEELSFLNFMVVSNIYLKRYREALNIIDSQIQGLNEDDPKIDRMNRMKEALEEAMKQDRKQNKID